MPNIHQSAKIKQIIIELEKYQFYHGPINETEYARFIGREAVSKRIIDLLENTKIKSGSYLITGFRGMGKTSVIRKAIKDINKNAVNRKKTAEDLLGFGKHKSKIWTAINNVCKTFFTIGILLIPISFILFLLCFILPHISDREITFSLNSLNIGLFIDSITAFNSDAHWSLILVFLMLLAIVIVQIIQLPFILWDCFSNCVKSFIKKSDLETYPKFEINLSQDSVSEAEILKRITFLLKGYIDKFIRSKEHESLILFSLYKRPIYKPFLFLYKLFTATYLNSLNDLFNVKYQLELLTLRTDAQVATNTPTDRNARISIGPMLPFGRVQLPLWNRTNKSKITYNQINSAKEIEDELIAIFKAISDLEYFKEINFIFIIDELDKISPTYSSAISQKEITDPQYDIYLADSSHNELRERQESVGKLLANLKGFLNVVQAKFFFIAGREMFDASLADTADRDSFYSSIFSDIIYVNTFFKDKHKRPGGITQMAETYLCKVLMAGVHTMNKSLQERIVYNLETFFLILQCNKVKIDDNTEHEISLDSQYLIEEDEIDINNDIHKKSIYKIIFELQQLILYLTYRSNGSPKKLISLIEEIIVSHIPNSEESNTLKLLRSDSKDESKSYLKINYKKQYEIGLLNNLYRPYVINNSRHLKSYGDKLLYSTGFILDHILKFHAFGFSWRNLELIPEVILVNKEPNLRSFINGLMRSLSRTCIRETVSGLFQYRFYTSTSFELKYISKISDVSSASYNFTLDESQTIKRHYKRRLLHLQQTHKGINFQKDDNTYINSTSFIQSTLGDLHFYDQEYDEALIYYGDSLQALRMPNNPKTQYKISRHQFFLWLRQSLLNALVFEKSKAYNSAFSIYRALCLDIPRYLNNIIDFGLDKEYDIIHPESTKPYRSLQLLTMPFIAWMGLIEKQRGDGITLANLKEKEHEIKLLLFENTRNLNDNKGFFDGYRQHYLLADYYNNLGSILFYKNHNFLPYSADDGDIDVYELLSKWEMAFKNENIRRKTLKIILVEKNEDIQPSLISLHYYINSLDKLVNLYKNEISNFLQGGYGIKITHPKLNDLKNHKLFNLISLPLLLLSFNTSLYSASRAMYIGNVLSKIGDAIISCLPIVYLRFEHDFINDYFGYKSEEKKEREEENKGQFSDEQKTKFFSDFYTSININFYSIETAISIYLLSAAFYLRAGKTFSNTFQLKKILYILKDALAISNNALRKEDISKIQNAIKIISRQIFKANSWNHDISNRPQLNKYRHIIKTHDRNVDRPELYNALNPSSDIRETIILCESIKVKLKKQKPELSLISENGQDFISPYSLISNIFTRMLELKYRAECNYHLINELYTSKASAQLKEFLFDQEIKPEDLGNYRKNRINKILKEDANNINELEFYIKDSLFCLRELLRVIALNSPGVVISHAYVGVVHEKMAGWSSAYRNYLLLLEASHAVEFKADTMIMIGSESQYEIEPKYQYQKAIQSYYSALQTHREGQAYKEYIREFYMLEDDYNDNFIHFVFTSERLLCNTGQIRKKIDKLHEKIAKSNLFKYESYV